MPSRKKSSNASKPTTTLPVVVHQHVTCPGCGCVCDDLTVEVQGDQLLSVTPHCELANQWYRGLSNPQRRTTATINGTSVPISQALEAAAKLLNAATSPVIYGLSHSSTAGQRAAAALADHIGSCIDTTASRCHAPAIVALQTVGESTSSLGEVRHRCDFVMFWGVDPVVTHPRHLERYSLDPTGMFVPGGRKDRHLVVVDVEQTATAERADTFLQVEPGRDFEVIQALRLLIAGRTPQGTNWGANPQVLRELAERMKTCRSGTVFFGLGLTRGDTAHRSVENLLRLTTELQTHTRFYARRMRLAGDVAGADSVLTWQTGFPFAVSLGCGWPRYNPGEFSANDLLEREEVDACLLVGGETVQTLSDRARHYLDRIPTIVLASQNEQRPFVGSVNFTTAVYGVHRSGTAYRMDEVPLPLPQLMDSELPSDCEILESLTERTTYRPGWGGKS